MDMPSYNFGHFDDDVSKEGNDLTVDTTFSTTDNTTLGTNTQSVLSNQELADISQVKDMGSGGSSFRERGANP